MLDRAFDLRQEQMKIQRFGDIVKRPKFPRFDGLVAVAVGGHDDEDALRTSRARLLERGQAIDASSAHPFRGRSFVFYDILALFRRF
jgi:hypothetical protein